MITLADELVRSILSQRANEIREAIGCPVIIVIASSINARKIIVGADFETGAIPPTAQGAAEVVARVCLMIAETPNPDDVKLYGDGRSS